MNEGIKEYNGEKIPKYYIKEYKKIYGDKPSLLKAILLIKTKKVSKKDILNLFSQLMPDRKKEIDQTKPQEMWNIITTAIEQQNNNPENKQNKDDLIKYANSMHDNLLKIYKNHRGKISKKLFLLFALLFIILFLIYLFFLN